MGHNRISWMLVKRRNRLWHDAMLSRRSSKNNRAVNVARGDAHLTIKVQPICDYGLAGGAGSSCPASIRSSTWSMRRMFVE